MTVLAVATVAAPPYSVMPGDGRFAGTPGTSP